MDSEDDDNECQNSLKILQFPEASLNQHELVKSSPVFSWGVSVFAYREV